VKQMTVEDTEVLIVGAGPAGLIAAREAARKGAEVTVLEQDAEIGLPCHCAGLLSLKGLDQIGVPPANPFVQNRVRGARFFSPSGLSFTIERNEPIACIADRSMFDKLLAEQATEAGATIKLDSSVKSIERTSRGVRAHCGEKSIATGVVIDAEGAGSRIVKDAKLKPLNPAYLLPGLQYDLRNVNIDPNYVEIHTGRTVAPEFFAWVMPLSNDSARVGLACRKASPKEQLERFIEGRFHGVDQLERTAFRAGPIITCGPIEKTFAAHILIVGDAAGQAKPITGGGVILGGICATIAGEVAAEAVRRKDFTATFLGTYESQWKKMLRREFRTTLLARKVMNRLSDKAIDNLFRAIIKQNLQEQLSTEGDMDFQRSILLKILKDREILRILPTFLRTPVTD